MRTENVTLPKFIVVRVPHNSLNVAVLHAIAAVHQAKFMCPVLIDVFPLPNDGHFIHHNQKLFSQAQIDVIVDQLLSNRRLAWGSMYLSFYVLQVLRHVHIGSQFFHQRSKGVHLR